MIPVREDMIPVVHRHVSNNITYDIFNQKTVKLKRCSCCGLYKPYSDYYLKAGFQNLHRYSIGEMHLRSYCISCYDHHNKNVWNKGNRPKPVYTQTLDIFFCDEVTNA